jgi:hypothetical protein
VFALCLLSLSTAGTLDLFTIPKEIQDYLQELDKFIDEKITPVQMADDNNRFLSYKGADEYCEAYKPIK